MRASKLIRQNIQPDTKEALQERRRHADACQQAREETIKRFHSITPENVKDILAWQESRIQQLLKTP